MPADPDVPADLVFQSVFQLCVTIAGAVLCACLAVVYLRKVRVERPAIGVFNHGVPFMADVFRGARFCAG